MIEFVLILVAVAAFIVLGNALANWLIAREMRVASERAARQAQEANAVNLDVSARLAQEVDRDEAVDREIASRIDAFLADSVREAME